MKHNGYDIVGDIHGYANALKQLLARFEYAESAGCYRHANRKMIFVGDFIDKGPAVRETLKIVRTMVERGAALAVMGNHEYNAIAYHTPDGSGGYFREHNPKNLKQHEATLQSFEGAPGELTEYLAWFGTLPLFLDLGGLRIVHACWDGKAIKGLDGNNRFDLRLLARAGTPRDHRQEAVNTLLKGPEIKIPNGMRDDEGRNEMRVKWWLNDRPLSYRSAALQVPFELPDNAITEYEAEKVCGYPENAPPVFFGHYGLKPAEPISANVACIDMGITRHGPLCAYRWDGEQRIDPGKLVRVSPTTINDVAEYL